MKITGVLRKQLGWEVRGGLQKGDWDKVEKARQHENKADALIRTISHQHLTALSKKRGGFEIEITEWLLAGESFP